MIVFREQVEGYEARVGEEWLRMSVMLDQSAFLGDGHNNLDQVTLSVLGRRFGTSTKILPQAYNYNIMGWGDPGDRDHAILHYHVFGKIWKAPTARDQVLGSMLRHLSEQEINQFLGQYGPLIQWRRARFADYRAEKNAVPVA